MAGGHGHGGGHGGHGKGGHGGGGHGGGGHGGGGDHGGGGHGKGGFSLGDLGGLGEAFGTVALGGVLLWDSDARREFDTECARFNVVEPAVKKALRLDDSKKRDRWAYHALEIAVGIALTTLGITVLVAFGL